MFFLENVALVSDDDALKIAKAIFRLFRELKLVKAAQDDHSAESIDSILPKFPDDEGLKLLRWITCDLLQMPANEFDCSYEVITECNRCNKSESSIIEKQALPLYQISKK